jgi:endogenous inhibitor of DNA gyrase (YacG/DUF329 family)
MTLANVEPLRKPVKCPNCEAGSQRDTYPFCSRRCSEMDLHRWFSESYTMPATQNDFDQEE